MKILLCAALAAAGLAAPAFADEGEAHTAEVRYSDLDLSTQAGRKMLDFRVEKAARNVCRVEESVVGTRILPKDRRTCYREARRQIDRQLAVLTAGDPAG